MDKKRLVEDGEKLIRPRQIAKGGGKRFRDPGPGGAELDHPRVGLRDAGGAHDHVGGAQRVEPGGSGVQRRERGELRRPVLGEEVLPVVDGDQRRGPDRSDRADGGDTLPAGAPDGDPPVAQVSESAPRLSRAAR